MVLAFRWTLRHNIDGLHLPPECLDSGKSHPCTLNAHRPLHSVDTWHRVNKPLHQTEITIRNRLGWPEPDYDVHHGSARYPMKFGPLGHLFIEQQGALSCAKLRPKKASPLHTHLALGNTAPHQQNSLTSPRTHPENSILG